MKDFLKRQCKNLILVLIYLIFANIIYIIWFNDLWHLWYIDVITGLVVTALGGFIAYKYIKSEEKKYFETHEVDAKDVDVNINEVDFKENNAE